jgi:hypothetical protein
MTGKPLLLIDVDGPLNPYAAKATRRPEGYTTHRLAPGGQTYRVWLNPAHGPMLLEFAERTGMELAWCTTWEHDANTMIGPVIGLPELPVVEFGYRATEWKFSGVLPYADDRPVAWLDDDFEHFPAEQEWFLRHREDIPTLLHHVSARVGITSADLDAVAAWLATWAGEAA